MWRGVHNLGDPPQPVLGVVLGIEPLPVAPHLIVAKQLCYTLEDRGRPIHRDRARLLTVGSYQNRPHSTHASLRTSFSVSDRPSRSIIWAPSEHAVQLVVVEGPEARANRLLLLKKPLERLARLGRQRSRPTLARRDRERVVPLVGLLLKRKGEGVVNTPDPSSVVDKHVVGMAVELPHEAVEDLESPERLLVTLDELVSRLGPALALPTMNMSSCATALWFERKRITLACSAQRPSSSSHIRSRRSAVSGIGAKCPNSLLTR